MGFLEELMSPAPGGAQLEVMKLPATCDANGKSLRELNLRARLGLQVLAIKREERYLGNPGPEEVLAPEDVVLVVGTQDKLELLQAELEEGAVTAD